MVPLLKSVFCYKQAADADLVSALAARLEEGGGGDIVAALRIVNHIHLVDHIFRSHLLGRPHGCETDWEETVPALQALADGFVELDGWYIDYIDALSPADLDRIIAFAFTDGARGSMSVGEMLLHVASHAASHRGEIGALLPGLAKQRRDTFAAHLHAAEPARRQLERVRA